jgi:hypothetical protein
MKLRIKTKEIEFEVEDKSDDSARYYNADIKQYITLVAEQSIKIAKERV